MTFALDCEMWGGRIRPTDGYGVTYVSRKDAARKTGLRPAHRVVYEETYGPIGENRHIHHLCGNPGCVTPDHLISVTRAQHNSMFGAKPPRKRFCSRGHDTAIFGRSPRGTCRECARETAREALSL